MTTKVTSHKIMVVREGATRLDLPRMPIGQVFRWAIRPLLDDYFKMLFNRDYGQPHVVDLGKLGKPTEYLSTSWVSEQVHHGGETPREGVDTVFWAYPTLHIL